ncbi:MAG: hypothetical protein QNJ47_05665 [Nostocaceae cyanobacterium]|nr:hypothetical protein [Nostocaceae cyanobacterium]
MSEVERLQGLVEVQKGELSKLQAVNQKQQQELTQLQHLVQTYSQFTKHSRSYTLFKYEVL